MLVRATTADKRIASISAQFIRHNDRNETVPCRLDDERAEFADIKTRSVTYGTRLIERGDEMMIALEE